MAFEGSDEFFNDGWREPGDDCERLACYILFAVGTLAGFGFLGWGLWTLAEGARREERLWGLFAAAVGASMAVGGVALFVKESKTWDLRHLTAERVVSGGMLFGLALMIIGAKFLEQGGTIARMAMLAVGTVDLTLFLVLGLAFAYAPSLRIRRRLAEVRVERRYALDDKLNEIDGHPCPREDGFTPVVTLRLRDGRTRTMVCAEKTYEILGVGRRGTAVVRGKRLERFHAG